MSNLSLLGIVLVLALCAGFWVDEGFFGLLVCVVIGVIFWFVFLHKYTPEQIAEKEAAEIEGARPVTITEKLSDGCILHKHYGKGKAYAHGYTEKYVSCPAADTTLIQSEKCGKHCTRDTSITVKGTP